MQISITGRHVEITEGVKDYAREKVSKLPRFYDRIRSIEVVLDHNAGNFLLEIIVRVDRTYPFIAHESGPDTRALIDTLTDKLGRQLRRHKERFRNRKHSGEKKEAYETETEAE